MSGIVGIINKEKIPVNKRLLEQMTDSMIFRGPDSLHTWTDDRAGFGHTLLLTTPITEKQPCSIDNQVWIVADARIDGHDELIASLRDKNREVRSDLTDAELILHAFHTWGNECIHHLIGDFAFAIWDTLNKKLFCARDHFGVKPFYYSNLAKAFVFSNTLETLLIHPLISRGLNDRAIGDFLLYGDIKDNAISSFQDIHRLPPAHSLSWSPGKDLSIQNYWNLTPKKQIRYKTSDEYTNHYKQLLKKAVNDRLRIEHAGILMSGGIDSTSIAVTAHKLLSSRNKKFDLRAYTFVYHHLIPDNEDFYAKKVADSLGIPFYSLSADEIDFFQISNIEGIGTLRPGTTAVCSYSSDLIKKYDQDLRIVLTGQGGDPATHPASDSIVQLLTGIFTNRMIPHILRYRFTHGRFPGLNIRTNLKQLLGKKNKTWSTQYPPWLNPAFEKKLDLREQWQSANKQNFTSDTLRSTAHRTLISPTWTNLFENLDPGSTNYPLELCHPFFDLRLISFLLALPPVPWCIDKHIMRTAMNGYLPEIVRKRPKSPLAGFPGYEMLQYNIDWFLNITNTVPELNWFVDVPRLQKMIRKSHKLRPAEYILISKPINLALWLKRIETDKNSIAKDTT